MLPPEPARTAPAAFEPHPGARSGVHLWLARHAAVHADWRGKAYEGLDVPLSAEGEAWTLELADRLAALRPDRVFASPLKRALDLGRAVAERSGAPLAVDPRLSEVRRGSWQGRAVEELYRADPAAIEAFYADPWTYDAHGGESDAALAARVWPAIEAALAGASGRVVVATHYNVIRVVVAGALGIPPPRSFGLRVDPGRLVLLHDGPDGWRLLAANTDHPASLEPSSLVPG
jgi:broad specificity phosphatase PhoE